MAQINPVRRLSLSLSSQKAGQKQKGQILAVSAQLMALVSALRSLSSVALSSARVSPVYHPFLTPLRQGDISTLQNRGHLYFALTHLESCLRVYFVYVLTFFTVLNQHLSCLHQG